MAKTLLVGWILFFLIMGMFVGADIGHRHFLGDVMPSAVAYGINCLSFLVLFHALMKPTALRLLKHWFTKTLLFSINIGLALIVHFMIIRIYVVETGLETNYERLSFL